MKKLIILLILLSLCVINCIKKRTPSEPLFILTTTPTATFTLSTLTPTITNTSSRIPSLTDTNTPTPTNSTTSTNTYTFTNTLTATNSFSTTSTSTTTYSPTDVSSPTETSTSTFSPSITTTHTNTPTPTNTVLVIYLTATIQCTCFTVDTCNNGPLYSFPCAITEDDQGAVWVSEPTTCAYIKRYNPITGQQLDSVTAYLVYGLEGSGNSYVQTWINDASYIQYFPTFTKPLSSSPSDHYRGLAYDGTYWWTIYAKGWGANISEPKLQKFSSTGELLESYDVSFLTREYYSNTLYDFSYSNTTDSFWMVNKNYLYKVSKTGQLLCVYDLGSWSFNGVHFRKNAYSTFWASYPPAMFGMEAKICYCSF